MTMYKVLHTNDDNVIPYKSRRKGGRELESITVSLEVPVV